jgi:predicted dithiol-disulfide oxidoreductase (DUF899 family)
MNSHRIVTHDEWIAARTALLAKEKEFTRLRDDLTRQRMELPWEKVEKAYVFEGPKGKESLADLFEGRSQLLVYHFMFSPEWDAGCPHCSFWADNFNPVIVHMNHRDVTFVAISRAPYSKLAAYEKRMGWSFKWLSSFTTDFNFDYYVSFAAEDVAKKAAFYNYTVQPPLAADREGVSAFYKDADGSIFHTYSAYARGIDLMNTAYNYLDIAPKGRDEGGRSQYWVRRHNEY